MRGHSCDWHGWSDTTFRYSDADYCWECDEKFRNAMWAVERVRELHQGLYELAAFKFCTECSFPEERIYVAFPCKTIKALDGEE